MATASADATLRLDRAFKHEEALGADTLDRKAFASNITTVLRNVSPDSGLVLAIEGPWGCGKSSVLAMVEALLKQEPEDQRPVVVHFNPWLVGDRDALLRQFLSSMAKAVSLTENNEVGKRVARELLTYSKVFDVLKLVPGAEPWASIVKSVVEAVGAFVEAVFGYKTPDLETSKKALAKALNEFPKRIVVLIDDLDRLYPAEAYEMVRIIKAVGDLPHVGYVLAWDEKYVSTALENLQVPFARSYLDKVVQARLPVPPLSFSQRAKLFDREFQRLPGETRRAYFPNIEERIQSLLFHGLEELIETPRDAVRLFDTLVTFEPGLRGEINLADMLALAALMIKAPDVYELLRRKPQAFLGHPLGGGLATGYTKEQKAAFATERQAFMNRYAHAEALGEMVTWLFPQTSTEKLSVGYQQIIFEQGHLAHTQRLSAALQLGLSTGDVSLAQLRKFIADPGSRSDIAEALSPSSCLDFVYHLIGVARDANADEPALAQLCVDIARMVERRSLVEQARQQHGVFNKAHVVSSQALGQISKRLSPEARVALARGIAADEMALSVAALLLYASFGNLQPNGPDSLVVDESDKAEVLEGFANHVEHAATRGELFDKLTPALILRALGEFKPKRCPAILDIIKRSDPKLDRFVEAMLQKAYSIPGGQIYSMERNGDQLAAFIALEDLKQLATDRLQDPALEYPLKAAWRAVVEPGAIYGVDGSSVVL